MDRTSLFLIPFMLMMGLSSCQLLDKKRAETSLETTLRAYENNMRWGEVVNAYGYLKPEMAKDMVIPEGLDNLQVTKYEVTQSAVSMNEKSVVTTATIHYLFKDQQILRTLTDKQVWELDKESNRWYRINPIPEFK